MTHATLLESIDDGHALPSSWYTDPAIFQRETERIFRRSWHYVTHTGELANVGDQFLCEIGGVPILLVRDRDSEIRGFVNICRHRAHPVVIEAGNHKLLQCHYHGWTYDLDGSLRRAPRSEDDADFDVAGICLVPVQTHVWGPMVWVNVDLDAPSFESWTEGLPELMAERGCVPADYVYGFEHAWDIDANWKVFQDNTIECYHCPTTHREFARLIEMDKRLQELYVGGRYWIHHRIPWRKGMAKSVGLPEVEGEPFYYYYHWVFPTTYLQNYGRGFDVGSVEITAVDRIRFRHIVFLPPGTSEEYIAGGQKQLEVDATIHQDVDICNRVQHAHAAGVAPAGTLLPSSEFLLQHFYRLVVEMTEGKADLG
jgi:choline monooxygenase